MSDEGDAGDGNDGGDDAPDESLDDAVDAFLRDVDAAHDDYDRGYTDADATLSVVMSHVERLREAHGGIGD